MNDLGRTSRTPEVESRRLDSLSQEVEQSSLRDARGWQNMEQETRNKIIRFFKDMKRMPSYRELADIAGYKSKNAAYKLVSRLEDAGFLSRDTEGKLLPGPLFNEVRVLGSVQAGFPTDAEEELIDTVSLDDYMIGNREATYLLTVQGDSMKDAGIQEGDLVIVERTTTAKEGDIVIAELDGDWTMKYLRKGKVGFFLEAANDAYPNLYPSEDLKIGGIVKGVLRKYL